MNRIFYIGAFCFLAVLVGIAFLQKSDSTSNKNTNTITVKNGIGNGIDAIIPLHPKRVVFLNSSSLDLWLGAGGKDKVSAYIEFNTAPQGLYEKLDKNAVAIGTTINVNIEKILEQKPDLVICGGSARGQQNISQALQSLGIPILAIDNESLEDTYYELSLYGEMNNQKAMAEKEINRIKNNIATIEKSYQDKKRPKVSLIWGTPASFSLMKPNSRQGEMLRFAGGENIVRDNSPSSRFIPVSLEYIAQEDPDYIFFIVMGDKQKIKTALDNLLSETSSWQILRAVKEKKVHVLPPELFTAHYGLSVDDSIKYMNDLLYK